MALVNRETGQPASAREKLKDHAEQSKTEYENTLLKDALAESSENCETLMEQCVFLLAQAEERLRKENEWNESSLEEWKNASRQRLEDLKVQISKLETANELLSRNIGQSLEGLTSNFKAEITKGIRDALRENEQSLINGVQSYQREVNDCVKTTEATMKSVSDKMQRHLRDYDEKQRQFFSFDGARSFIFWAGCLTNIAALVLLVYFVFWR